MTSLEWALVPNVISKLECCRPSCLIFNNVSSGAEICFDFSTWSRLIKCFDVDETSTTYFQWKTDPELFSFRPHPFRQITPQLIFSLAWNTFGVWGTYEPETFLIFAWISRFMTFSATFSPTLSLSHLSHFSITKTRTFSLSFFLPLTTPIKVNFSLS